MLLVFPVWVSRVKCLCNVCVCGIVSFYVFIKNMFAVFNCTMLKSTFTIELSNAHVHLSGREDEIVWAYNNVGGQYSAKLGYQT
jgi:hypothetical protein